MRALLVPLGHLPDALRARAIVLAAIIASLVAAACSGDLGPERPRLEIAAGDGQHALAGTELPEPIVVLLRDGADRPLVGVRVTWVAQSGLSDEITPVSDITDANGQASARWRLGATAGTHTVVVTADGGATKEVSAVADANPSSHVMPLPIATYDGSGQAVHPDFARVPAAWNGDPFRLVATPYPGGDANYENPSLYTGSGGAGWLVPSGVQNPIESPNGGSYLSDPDMVYDPVHAELRIYYRRVTTENEIWLTRSSDGVVWSTPEIVAHAPNHMIVSPTIVRRSATQWLMWSVNSGVIGCGASSTVVELRHSNDGVTWSAAENTDLQDSDGSPWHIDVEWLPSRREYWAVYPIKQGGGCTTKTLRFATSRDGVHWTTYPSPLLTRGANDDLRDVVYRSTFDVDESSGVVSLWYSGAKFDHSGYSWHLAWEQTSIEALFARVNEPVVAAARIAAAASPTTPELTNESAP